MRRQPRIKANALEKTLHSRGAHGGSLVMSRKKSSHPSDFVSHSLNLGFGFPLLHWHNSSPCRFHTSTTYELSLASKKSSVPPRFGEKPPSVLGALTELLPQLIAKPFPLGNVALHHPPLLMGWKEHHHPHVPAPRHCVSPGAEGKYSANTTCP